jgi:hypothetical protein
LLEIERAAELLASQLYDEAVDQSEPVYHAMRRAADALSRLLDLIVTEESEPQGAS